MRGVGGPGGGGRLVSAVEIGSAERFARALREARGGAAAGGVGGSGPGDGRRGTRARELDLELWDPRVGRFQLHARIEGDRVWIRTRGGRPGRAHLERYRARLEAALAEAGMRVVAFLPGPAKGG